MTALERFDYLEIFRLQLFHMKMAKVDFVVYLTTLIRLYIFQVMQDYKFCMKSEQNLDDEGTLGYIAAILGLAFASNDPQKIKKQGNFEKHDQLFMDLATQYLVNALENYLSLHPASLLVVDSEASAEQFVLEFLAFSKIEFFFKVDRTEDDDADDMLTYCRDCCSRLVLSLMIDRAEKQEDPVGLRGIRRIMIPYFLNRKSQVQDSKVRTELN